MEDRRPPVLVVSITIFVVATVFVALRFVSRIGVVKRVGLHDYFMLLAWVWDACFLRVYVDLADHLGLSS